MPELKKAAAGGPEERLARFLDEKIEESKREALQFPPVPENLVLFVQMGQTIRNLEALREKITRR